MPRPIRQIPGGMALHVLRRGVGHPTLFHRVQYSLAAGGSSANQIRPTGLTYPSGRVITYDYGIANGNDDVLNRLENIKDGATTLAGYTYLGAGTAVRIDYPQPQVRLDLWGGTSGSYAGLDRFGRIVKIGKGAWIRFQRIKGFDTGTLDDNNDWTSPASPPAVCKCSHWYAPWTWF